jgi:predicted AlkP superfamily pyrophosphatase or phosphodiesterase
MQKLGCFFYRPVLIACVVIFAVAAPAMAAPVLMISVDGLKPEYVLQADDRGLKIPYLRSVVSEGVYADGVVGVWPTNTYPSHTTLVTGVSPAEHGIFTNLEFDPEHRFKDSWFWYAQQIRVPTLWQAVHGAGLVSASVGWPATVGATDIDYLIPEFWRNMGSGEDLNPSERNLIAALSRPDNLLAQMQQSVGPYLMGNDTSVTGDEIKTRFSIEIMHLHKPAFMSIHLSSLDAAEHSYGVFSAQANGNLEAIDAMLSRLAAAARANNSAVIVAVVSDHGFTPITHKVNLYVPLVRAGLIEITQNAEVAAPKIASWKAQPWLASGMAAIMLKDPSDRQTEQQVGELLQKLAADPNNGIASIYGRTQIKQLGGFPEAAFIVALTPGFYAGDSLTGEFVTDIHGTHGGHGFSPEAPEMRAAFFISGAGVARHRDLGVIDMRQIAPTVAQLLGVSLPTAKATPLRLAP